MTVVVKSATAVQFIPSVEYAIPLPPLPTATNRFPFHATPRPSGYKIVLSVTPVQLVFPSSEYAIVFAPYPTATNLEPFHATPYPASVNITLPRPVHVLPSYDHAIVCVLPLPTAINIDPFHATPYPAVVKVPFPLPVHLIPSLEYAIVFVVPLPTATHIDPLHATPYPAVVKISFPIPVHNLPSLEYAIVLSVPSPTATVRLAGKIFVIDFLKATPYPFEKTVPETLAHLIPSSDHAILLGFSSSPTATNLLFVSSHATPFPSFVNTSPVACVQLAISVE